MILRSGKVIPTMMCGIFFIHQRYTAVHYFGAGLVSVGMALFTLADNKISPEFNMYGVGLALLSIFADAMLSNLQQKILQSFGSPQSEMVILPCCQHRTLTQLLLPLQYHPGVLLKHGGGCTGSDHHHIHRGTDGSDVPLLGEQTELHVVVHILYPMLMPV